mmetsp:Transcript_39763/g.62198  ORF Transcript_39763/g.62198 Transcript_39763/m.62198 type:complete len:192 (+) Transcript_39763:23-598(+)
MRRAAQALCYNGTTGRIRCQNFTFSATIILPNVLFQRQYKTLEGISFFPMPKLSPMMESGIVTKWLKKEGDSIEAYDVICHVSTDSLVEKGERVGKFAGEVVLEVEAQEPAVLAKVLHGSGGGGGDARRVPAGTALAVLCEDADQAAAAAALPWDELPNLLDEGQVDKANIQVASWQAYLLESNATKKPPP